MANRIIQAEDVAMIHSTQNRLLRLAMLPFLCIGLTACKDSGSEAVTAEGQVSSTLATAPTVNEVSDNEEPTTNALVAAEQTKSSSDSQVTEQPVAENRSSPRAEDNDSTVAEASDAVATGIEAGQQRSAQANEQPVPPTQNLAAEQVAAVVLGNAYQATQLLDMRDVTPFKLEQLSTHDALQLDYTCNADVDSALEYHRELLLEAGWKFLDSGGALDAGSYRSRFFVKESYLVQLAVNAYSAQLAGVNLQHLGNVDARQLPMVEDAKHDSKSTAWGAMYKTNQSVEEVAKYCRTKMAEIGWMEYKSVASNSELPYESGGARVIPFVQNGVTCYLNISPPSLFSGQQTTPAYFLTGLIAQGISVPPGATQIELDRTLGNVSYGLDLPLAEAVMLVESPMQQFGWQDQPALRRADARQAKSVHQADDETIFLAEFSERGFADTHVSIQSFDASDLDVMLAESSPSADTDTAELSEFGTDLQPETASELGAASPGTIAASDFPLPKGAKITSPGDPLMIKSSLSPEKVAEFYDQALGELGWQRNAEMSQDMEDGTSMLFYLKQGTQIAVFARVPSDDYPSIFVQGDGIEWPTPDELFAEVEDFGAGLLEETMEEGFDEVQVVTDNALAANAENTTAASATLGSTTVKLDHGIAYQVQQEGRTETIVLLTDRELPEQELLIQLAEMSEVSLFDLDGRIPQYIEVSWNEDYKSCNLMIAGASVSGIGDELDIDVEADQGWIRGSISLREPREVFDDKLTFSATFDLAALSPLDLTDEMLADSQRPLQEVDGLPVPASAEESYREGGPYSTTSHASIETELADVIELYRAEMPALGWKEVEHTAQPSSESAVLKFAGSEAELEVQAERTDDGVELTIVRRDVAQAKKDKILPADGKAKLVFGNAFDQDVVIAIGQQDYKVKAGVGADDPKDALNYDVAPGKYKMTIKIPGEPEQTETVNVQLGTTWGVMVLPNGVHFADRLY